MMKRIFSISFAAYLLIISLGLTINVHYCGGKIASFQIVSTSTSCCCDTETKSCSSTASDCCSDDSFIVMLDSDYQFVQNFQLTKKYSTDYTSVFFNKDFSISLSDQALHPLELDLPPPFKRPSYLLNSSFLFYG